jgi:hypothetical protein
MGYIGNQTSNSYTSITKQTITGNGGASYTLDHAVANVNEIEVFVNNVRQEPAVAYTVSGTALTMTGNVASTDDFYVVFQGKAIQTTVPPDDSVTTARINDGAVTAAKVDSTLHLSTIKDSTGTNNAMTIDSSGRVSMPARPSFLAYADDGWVGITAATQVTLPLDHTLHNVGSHYDTSTKKFTCPVAGLYTFTAQTYVNNTAGTYMELVIKRVNNTAANLSYYLFNDPHADQSLTTSVLYNATAGDEIQALIRKNVVTANTDIYTSKDYTFFCGAFLG